MPSRQLQGQFEIPTGTEVVTGAEVHEPTMSVSSDLTAVVGRVDVLHSLDQRGRLRDRLAVPFQEEEAAHGRLRWSLLRSGENEDLLQESFMVPSWGNADGNKPRD